MHTGAACRAFVWLCVWPGLAVSWWGAAVVQRTHCTHPLARVPASTRTRAFTHAAAHTHAPERRVVQLRHLPLARRQLLERPNELLLQPRHLPPHVLVLRHRDVLWWGYERVTNAGHEQGRCEGQKGCTGARVQSQPTPRGGRRARQAPGQRPTQVCLPLHPFGPTRLPVSHGEPEALVQGRLLL
jgi:hypothetical protein